LVNTSTIERWPEAADPCCDTTVRWSIVQFAGVVGGGVTGVSGVDGGVVGGGPTGVLPIAWVAGFELGPDPEPVAPVEQAASPATAMAARATAPTRLMSLRVTASAGCVEPVSQRRFLAGAYISAA
jgi:hypothetical protein